MMRTRQTTQQSRSMRQTAGRSVRVTSLLMLLAAGGIIVVLVVLFPLEWVQVPAVTVTTGQRAFSPNGDNNLDELVLVYGLSQDAAVTIQVLGANQQVVRTLVQEETQVSGQHSVLWDGHNDAGAVVTDGEYTVRIAAKGAARTATRNIRVRVDNTPPVLRLANLPDDLKVGQPDLLIEGATEPGSTLWLNDLPQPIAVGADGGFSVPYQLREGANRIELTAVDPSGNVASVTRDVTLVLRPPDLVLANPPDDLWINQRMLSVQGRAAPDAQVLVNGKAVSTDSEGRFNVDVLLEEGENIVQVKATDAVGNETVVERRVFLKLQPPPITLTSVEDGAQVHEPALLVAGQTEPNTIVRINGQEVAVDTQGGFQGVVNLVEGVNLIRIEAVDRANNAAVVTRNVTYTTVASRPTGSTLRTALMAGGAGAALVLALWILLGGLYGPNALSLSSDQPFLSSNPYNGQDVRFALELARPAQVTVQVWNRNDELVATLMSRRRRRAGLHLLEWNGIDDLGRVVPDGVYEVEATASTIFTTVTNRLSIVKTSAPAPQIIPQYQTGEMGGDMVELTGGG